MEVGQHQELEMTEAATKVYDIIHPTPVSLKELSAVTISLELWRCKMNEYRTSGQLEELDEYKLCREYTWIKSILPNLPSSIYKTIEKIFKTVADSIDFWLFRHHERVFSSYSHRNHVLEYFDDFVCDYDGSIHYLRTAERMMRCVAFNTVIKFTIACTYFFEDYIRRTWPSVSRHLKVEFNRFRKSPQLNYWIYRLRNQLEMVPMDPPWMNYTVDERMLMFAMHYNRPSVEYFWNRLPYEKQNMRNISNICMLDFVRFILPKLDEGQLYEFVNPDTSIYLNEGFYSVVRQLHLFDGTVILKTWSFIKNIMNKRTFTYLVCKLIEIGDFDCEEFDYEKWGYLCSEIWNDAPLNLKKSVIRLISSESTWFEEMNTTINIDSNEIHVEFLLLILQDASLKQRNSFWRNCWETLIEVVEIDELQRIMQPCFENDDEIAKFKKNVVIDSEATYQLCVSFLKESLFDELNTFVSFCCPDLQSTRNLKQEILESAVLGEDCKLGDDIVFKIKKFNEFVNDAFENVVELGAFKNTLMTSSSVMKRLSRNICSGRGVSLENLIEFIDTLVSKPEAVMQVKMILIDSLKEYVTNTVRTGCDKLFRKKNFNSILLWCLDSEEKVDEFKSTCTALLKISTRT